MHESLSLRGDPKHAAKSNRPAIPRGAKAGTTKGLSVCLLLIRVTASFLRSSQRFAREIVEREGQQGEHQDGNPIAVEGVRCRKQQQVTLVEKILVRLERNAEQADDAAGGNQS